MFLYSYFGAFSAQSPKPLSSTDCTCSYSPNPTTNLSAYVLNGGSNAATVTIFRGNCQVCPPLVSCPQYTFTYYLQYGDPRNGVTSSCFPYTSVLLGSVTPASSCSGSSVVFTTPSFAPYVSCSLNGFYILIRVSGYPDGNDRIITTNNFFIGFI